MFWPFNDDIKFTIKNKLGINLLKIKSNNDFTGNYNSVFNLILNT